MLRRVDLRDRQKREEAEKQANVRKLDFAVFPKQAALINSKGTEILWGGAAGPGKSHGARIAAIAWCTSIPGLQLYLFRREYNDLIKNHMEGPTGFRAMLQPLVEAKRVVIREKEIEFVQEKSKIFLCHCQYENDVYGYQGAEIHVLILEEATQFSEFQIKYLRSRVRMPEVIRSKIPEHYQLPVEFQTPTRKFCFPRCLYTSNPGGLGHDYLKKSIVLPAKKLAEGGLFLAPDSDGGFIRQFVPAKLKDNPAVNPVEYTKTLMGLPPQLVKALLEGDWDAVIGAFFPECDYTRHVIPNFNIPNWWFRFRTYDWGSYAPFSCLWWAVSDGEHAKIPRGSLVCYREWYGAQTQDHRKGLSMSNFDMAKGILERTSPDEMVSLTICDNRPYQATGGKRIADEFESAGCLLTQGDTRPGSRHQGWSLLRSRLIGLDGRPLIYFTNDCPLVWQHLTQIQVDPHDQEDLDSSGIDHDIDAVGLACKARPTITDEAKPIDEYRVLPQNITFNDAVSMIQRQKARENGRFYW